MNGLVHIIMYLHKVYETQYLGRSIILDNAPNILHSSLPGIYMHMKYLWRKKFRLRIGRFLLLTANVYSLFPLIITKENNMFIKSYNPFKINFHFCNIHPLQFIGKYSSFCLKTNNPYILKSWESSANLARISVYPGKAAYMAELENPQNI